jgi:hypothetical protein
MSLEFSGNWRACLGAMVLARNVRRGDKIHVREVLRAHVVARTRATTERIGCRDGP